MMTREQIERIAANCGVEVSYAEMTNGGFVIDTSNDIYESVNDIFMGFFGSKNSKSTKYFIDDETALFAA